MHDILTKLRGRSSTLERPPPIERYVAEKSLARGAGEAVGDVFEDGRDLSTDGTERDDGDDSRSGQR